MSLRRQRGIHPRDQLMLWSAFTLAFFGFLRVSEFTADTLTRFRPESTLLDSDYSLTSVLTLNIKASKTDPLRRGHTVTIAPSRRSVCAMRAMHHYNPPATHKPLYRFVNGSYLTRQTLTKHVRNLLTHSMVPNSGHYASHSFRRGAATTAADAGLPDWLIKVLGRWRSDAYQVYVSTPNDIICKVPALLAGNH